MATRGRSLCDGNTNYTKKAPWLKPVYCPVCGRKIGDLNIADGYYTCDKCRYNFYKVMISRFEVNVSAELLENNWLVKDLVMLIRKQIFKIMIDGDITKTERDTEYDEEEDELPFS